MCGTDIGSRVDRCPDMHREPDTYTIARSNTRSEVRTHVHRHVPVYVPRYIQTFEE